MYHTCQFFYFARAHVHACVCVCERETDCKGLTILDIVMTNLYLDEGFNTTYRKELLYLTNYQKGDREIPDYCQRQGFWPEDLYTSHQDCFFFYLPGPVRLMFIAADVWRCWGTALCWIGSGLWWLFSPPPSEAKKQGVDSITHQLRVDNYQTGQHLLLLYIRVAKSMHQTSNSNSSFSALSDPSSSEITSADPF